MADATRRLVQTYDLIVGDNVCGGVAVRCVRVRKGTDVPAVPGKHRHG